MARALAFLVAAVVVATWSAAAQDPPKADAPAADLAAAKRAYQADLAKAGEALLGEFAAEEKRLLDNTKLKIDDKIKRGDQLQEEKKLFETQDLLPKTPGLKVATDEYRSKVTAAGTRCGKAFDKVAEQAGKTDLAAAKAVLAEKAEFFKEAWAATRVPGPAPAGPPKPAAAGPAPLVGTWQRTVSSTTTILKHVTPTHFTVTQYDGTGRVFLTHGGRYLLKGEAYQEAVEYGFGPGYDALKDTTVKRASKLDGKKWTLRWTDAGRNYQETWDLVEPKPLPDPGR